MQYANVPLYVSPPTIKSLGNEYSIFADRIALQKFVAAAREAFDIDNKTKEI